MTDELLAYLLDDLAPAKRAEVQLRLEQDPAWREELKRLEACLQATGDPCQCADERAAEADAEPPQDLVAKTCCFVERACQRHADAAQTPAALYSTTASCTRLASWSLSDLCVGGGVLLLLGMLLAPAIRESRDASRQLACQNNLRLLGQMLFRYQEAHGRQLPSTAPGRAAGLFVLDLADLAGVSRHELDAALVCPNSELAERVARGLNFRTPSRAELAAANGPQLAEMFVLLAGAYAYRLGYFDEQNVYHVIPFSGDEFQPMIADAPRFSPDGVRSANHGGCGQWVLYQDLGVRFRGNCDLDAGIDNIFLNRFGKHAGGRGESDVVMGVSACDANGPIVPFDAAP